MKLLLDQNLPRSLVPRLTGTFPGSQHVINIGLDASAASDIFNYAREHGFTILSKDSDFRQLSFVLSANEQRLLEFETGPESFLVVERAE